MSENTKHVNLSIAPEIVEEWDEEREEMNMSRSEYVRHHVEAGRKELSKLNPTNKADGNSLEEDVLNVIPEDDAIPPEEIVEQIIEPLNDEILNEILPRLDDHDQITYSPADGGYKKI